MEKFNIPLHGPSLNIVRRCGPALRDVLQSKFGCEATIEGVDFESDASVGQLRRPPVDPVKKFSFMLRGCVELSVWKADLTNFKVDAVVNAANEFLKHGGGLAYALSIAGGSQIQKESDDYINKHGQLGTGDAIALDAGCLPCKKIIHAVGPCLPKHPSSTEVSGVRWKLEMAIESILHQVEIHRLQSVAIPAISSGLFNFPLPECADIIVETVNRYYQSSQSSRSHVPREIRLANHDDITVSEMERACLQLLGSGSSSSSSKGATRTQTPEVQIGKVHLTLKKGKIEDQLTDVIVNTTSPERDLTIGEVSKALLLKAGYEMQKEIYNVSSTGRLLITNSYYLKCKKVFHTVCQAKGTFRQNATPKQVLGDSVTQCLQNAAKNRYKSIAFPAIGTGNLGFDKKEVAAIMAKAVFDFAHNCQTEIDVMFIIYPTDDQTYKAFEEQMVTLQQRAPRPQETGAMMSSPPEYEHRNDSHSSRAPTPQITLGGPSEETIREAGRWLSDYLHKSYSHVNISNNFIQHFGEREHLQLSRLMKKGVVIEEIFKGGHARISVTGNSSEDAVVAGFQVEAMLCNVQEEFVRDEEDAMCEALGEKRVDFERKKVDYPGNEFSDRFSAFKKEGLRTVKVDKVVNPSLKRILDLKATQLRCSTQKMFQLIPAQFCEMVCKIGFHAEYAPPGEAAYGEGIYFAGTVKKAMEVWKEQKEHQKEEYLYFVEAEVLTGISIPGTPGLILPPPVWEDPLLLHASVSGGPDVSVIFSGYQALPTYIITCRRD